MIPGLGFFYAGLTRTKNALSLILICILAAAIVAVQWMLVGFSLSFSESSSNVFIGNFHFGGFTNVGSAPFALTAPAIPAITLALYQLQFASITPAIIFGSVAERFRLLPAMVFVFLWSTFVYDFIAFCMSLSILIDTRDILCSRMAKELRMSQHCCCRNTM